MVEWHNNEADPLAAVPAKGEFVIVLGQRDSDRSTQVEEETVLSIHSDILSLGSLTPDQVIAATAACCAVSVPKVRQIVKKARFRSNEGTRSSP
jgi:hypothetical protein